MHPDTRATKTQNHLKKRFLFFSYCKYIQTLCSKFGICRVNIIAARGDPSWNAIPALLRASLRHHWVGLKKRIFFAPVKLGKSFTLSKALLQPWKLNNLFSLFWRREDHELCTFLTHTSPPLGMFGHLFLPFGRVDKDRRS